MTNNPALEHVRCNLCGSTNEHIIYCRPYSIQATTDAGTYVATTDQFTDFGTIVQCVNCGLVYTNPRPERRVLMGGYQNCVDDNYLLESSSRSINAHLCLNTIKKFLKTGRLLEVGSSIGYFLNAARVDFDVHGIEPSEWACQIARTRFKLDVHPEAFEGTSRFPPGSMDIVVMNDVIEHMSDPKACLRSAAAMLRKGGLLYLVTPDIESLSAKILRSNWWGLRPAHIYYFSRQTLTMLLEELGFEIVLCQSYGRIFSYGYWLSRLRHYPAFISGTANHLINLLDINEKLVYINTRDSLELCARLK